MRRIRVDFQPNERDENVSRIVPPNIMSEGKKKPVGRASFFFFIGFSCPRTQFMLNTIESRERARARWRASSIKLSFIIK